MSRKLFNVVTVLVMLSMLIIPVSAQQPAAQPGDPDSKLQFEAVNPEDIKQVGNPNATVKGEIKGATGEANYIVRLADAPLASYRGGVDGLDATNPASRGAVKLDMSSQASQDYLAYLEAEQARMISLIEAEVGRSVDVLHQFQVAYNGLALTLTPDEAAQVAKLPGVVNVTREFLRYPTTDAGPAFIGAPDIWNGITTPGMGTFGEGVVVGIIDTGLNMDNPSFADVGDDGYDHTNPLGAGNYLGLCDTDPGTWVCNDKLIGYYIFTGETTEDTDGHGSHTASTTAGNVVYDAEVAAPTASYTADISGVAPHANIIGYDGCLDGGGCPFVALVAAIDQATADGVDVINYSIGGGTSDPWADDDALAFLGAVDAGVIPVTSAGNAGPGAATLGSPAEAPWMLAVGASTHDRYIRNDLVSMTGGDTTPPADMIGKGLAAGYGPADIVYAGDYGNALCGPGVWAAGTFSGEIVVCDRGTFGRVEKSEVVLAAGGGGYVLANNAASADTLNGDPFALPGVHITYDDGVVLKAWLASGTGHQATISGFSASFDPSFGDAMASFSSRGPSPSVPWIIKPDVTAPGLDIMAAYSDPEVFNIISGTSMSSPHTAGAAALMRALYPSWTVAEIKSALMATAVTGVVKEDGATPADPFDMGAGRVNLSGAGLAALVLDITTTEYQDSDPSAGGDPKTLNLPSMADNQCLESCTWTRTVTNPTADSMDWTVSTDSDDGVIITVDPASFTLAGGASQQLTITADVTGLPTGSWLFGEVMFVEDSAAAPDAHFPLAVVPTAGILPASVDITTRRNAGSELETGLQSIEITELTTEYFGLTQATLTSEELTQDPTNGDPYDNLNDGTTFFITTTVPAGAKRLVAEITYSEAPDIDLFVGTGDTPSAATLECSSTSPTASEKCDVADPAEGTWWMLVQNWAESVDTPDLVTLASAVVPGEDSGNLMVTGPASVPAGTPFDIRVYWDTPEMMAGDRWYGAFSLGSDAGNPGNIATIPVNIVREDDDVTKEASAEVAAPGDTVTYTITVQPNVFSTDLNYTITDTIPAGMTYVPGSASASDGTVDVVGNTVSWTGLMATPRFSYNIETSVTDPAMCVMPLANSGAYVNLQAYGIAAQSTISGDSVWYTVNFSGGAHNFFNEYFGEVFNFTDDGFAFFDPATPGTDPWTNLAIPTPGDPDNLLAIFWRDMEIVYEGGAANRGVSLANLTSGGVPVGYVIEYDNVEDWPAGENPAYDIELFGYYDDQPGDYEYIMAYDNLEGDVTVGTIGLENKDGTIGAQYGFDDLDIVDGMAICFDQVQLGANPITITYQVTVDAEVAPLTELTNNAAHNTDNMGSMEAVASDTVRVEGVRLEVAHLAPFAADPGTAVTVTLNGAPALTNFEFADSTGYIPLPPGDYDMAVFPAGATDPAISGTVSLMDGMDYSAIATGDGVNQALGLLALVDDNSAPAAGTFHLRIGHLAPFASGDALADVRLQDGTVILDDVAFGDVTGFTPLPVGEYDLKITSPDGATTYIDPLPVTFTDGQIVSAYAVGDGVNQPLGVFAWPAGVEGFLLPLAEESLARLAIGHLAPFAMDPGTAVTVTLNGTPVLTGFEFADSTAYLDIPAGITHTVEIFAAGVVTPAISAEINLMEGMDYSAVAVGGANSWPLDLLALLDDNAAPAAGNFKLRLGHLAPFADTEAGTLADVRLQDGTLILDDVPFGAVAGYLELAAGTYDLKITSPDGMTTYIDPLPVTFAEGDIVTAFAVGDGVNQPLGVFAWPSDAVGFLLPLEGLKMVYLPLVPQGYTVP